MMMMMMSWGQLQSLITPISFLLVNFHVRVGAGVLGGVLVLMVSSVIASPENKGLTL